MECGGIEISNNKFQYNMACTKVGGGLIDIQCVETGGGGGGLVDYLDEV